MEEPEKLEIKESSNTSIQNFTLLKLDITVKMENITPEQLIALRVLVEDIMKGTYSYFNPIKSQ